MSEVSSKEDVVTYLAISVEKDATLNNTPYTAFKLTKKTLKKKETRTLFHQQAIYLTAVNVGEKNTYLESFLSDVNVFDHFYPDIERLDSKFEICAVFEGTKKAVEKLRSFFSTEAAKKPFALGYGTVGRNSHFSIWANNGEDRSLDIKKSSVFHMPGFLKYDPVPLSYFCARGNLYGLFEGQVQENATLLQLNSNQCMSANPDSGKVHNVFTVSIEHNQGQKPCLVFDKQTYQPPLDNFSVGKEGLYLDFMSYQERNQEFIDAFGANVLEELDHRTISKNLKPLIHLRVWAFIDGSFQSYQYLRDYLDDYNKNWKADGGEDHTFDIKVTDGKGGYLRSEVNTKKPKTLLLHSHAWFGMKYEPGKKSSLAFDEPKSKSGIQTALDDLKAAVPDIIDDSGNINCYAVAAKANRVFSSNISSALEEVKTSKAVASIPGKVLTQDVVVGFDAYEDLGMGVTRSKGLNLTLKIEKRDGVPSLRQSNLFITTAKAKGYGPVFIVDEDIALSLSEVLQEFYKRSTTNKPVFGFTDVCTDDQSKPVNTPLGKLFEAQLTFKGDDTQRQTKFFDFGVKDLEA